MGSADVIDRARLLNWAAGLSVVAGLVHGALTDAHFQEWWAFGVFFMLAATAQGLYGFAILASHLMNGAPITGRWPPQAIRGFYVAGIVGNGALVLMYLASRTIGVLGDVEPWDGLGIFTKLLEVSVILLLATLLAGGDRRSVATLRTDA